MTDITMRSDIKVDLVDVMGNDQSVARSARVSTGNDLIESEKITGLINYLVKASHTSTLEHCVATFRIEAPLFVVREWQRHRTQSFNELSGRYAKLKPEFYFPGDDRPLINKGSGAHPDLQSEDTNDYARLQGVVRGSHIIQAEEAWAAYEHLLELGVATEVARNVLPVSTYTAFYATANLNNWFKFLWLRDGLNGSPQWEISQGANQIKDILREKFPITVSAWEKHRVTDTQ